MRAIIKDSIRVDADTVPRRVLHEIQDALTIRNPAKTVARRELLWGWQRMPDHLVLYSYDDGWWVLPLGFLHALRSGAAYHGVELVLDDRRQDAHYTALGLLDPIPLRGYQEPAVQALLEGECGVVEAPTAAGKTMLALEAVRRSGQRAVVIVEKASLAHQWRRAILDHLGFEAGYIGEGEREESEAIIVALRQAIWAHRESLWAMGFFASFGCVIIDEVHHVSTAETLIDVVQRFTSRYRWGITATPDRDPDWFPVLQAIVGPVLWETTMVDAGEHLVIPSVRVLESDFEFDFVRTHYEERENGRRRRVQNNYASMMSSLCSNRRRNLMLATTAAVEARAGHHVLVVSQRKQHLEAIREMLGEDQGVDIHMLTGSDKGTRAAEIKQEVESAHGGSILLSTVADEGLSIDRLDRVIAAYPRRNPETMRQIVGRVMRPFPGKTDAVLIDVFDARQPVLRSQFRTRAQQLFNREGWEVRCPQSATTRS